jgi:hypothetical protein
VNRKILCLIVTAAMFTLFISSAHARLTHTDYDRNCCGDWDFDDWWRFDDWWDDGWSGCCRPGNFFVVPEVPLGTVASLSAMFLGIASLLVIRKVKSK